MFGRLIRLCTPNWAGPLTAVEARAIAAPARVVAVEAIEPDSWEHWLNIADGSCPSPPEGCGGAGRTSQTIDGVRQWVPCSCVDPSRAS